ncbi:hypothetical protein N2152v2_000452 [Parachlorella kessleri]
MIPGLVLGGICLIGFLLMLLWMCVRWRRQQRLSSRGKQQRGGEGGTQDVPTAGGSMTGGPPTLYQPPAGRRHRRWANLLAALLLLLALATVGTGAWAMGESIVQTNDVVSNFWDLVAQVEAKVVTAQQDLATLSHSLELLQPAVARLRNRTPELITATSKGLGIPLTDTRQGLYLLAGMPQDSMEGTSSTINSTVLPLLRDQILEVVHDVQDYQSSTQSLQDTWRFVLLCVLFGLLILSVVATTVLCLWKRFGRWASLLVALTWLLTALVMLGGVGLMNGVVVVSGEGCLYLESYIYDVAQTKLSDPARTLVLSGMDYYFGVRNLTGTANDVPTAHVDGYDPELAEAILNQLTGADITDVLLRAQEVQEAAVAFGGIGALNAKLVALEAYGIDPDTIQVLQDGLTGLAGILLSTTGLVENLRRASIEPIYHGFKGYLCCDVSTSGHWLYVSWTVAGSIALAFCVAASFWVIWQTLLPQDPGWAATWGQAPPPPPVVQLSQQGIPQALQRSEAGSTSFSKSGLGGSGDLSSLDSFSLVKEGSSIPPRTQLSSILEEAGPAAGGPSPRAPDQQQQPPGQQQTQQQQAQAQQAKQQRQQQEQAQQAAVPQQAAYTADPHRPPASPFAFRPPEAY